MSTCACCTRDCHALAKRLEKALADIARMADDQNLQKHDGFDVIRDRARMALKEAQSK